MGKLNKIIGGGLLLAILISGGVGYNIYNQINIDNVQNHKGVHELFIPTGASYDDVLSILARDSIIIDLESFKWIAEEMNYPNRVYAGRYLIKDHWSNRKIISELRIGEQTDVKVIINKFRTEAMLAGHVSRFIEADSLDLLNAIANKKSFGQIIPNTYKFRWNTDANGFVDRMDKEYDNFWDDDRTGKAKDNNLTPHQAIVVASIVEEESNKEDELERIAGVYINRLDRGIKLQADPTVRYAIGNFELQRILKKHLKYPSPYNTYLNKGLPPGPICTPSIVTIEAVLNAEDHDYIFFCAKADFSGYHVFAKTLAQHNQNARKFHRAMNDRGIR